MGLGCEASHAGELVYADGVDLDESKVAVGVDQAGVDAPSGHVDPLYARGELDLRADRGDAPVRVYCRGFVTHLRCVMNRARVWYRDQAPE